VPRLSIVIPVLGGPQQLDDTLLSVLENRPANCEVLVVHNEPYHDPYHLSDEVRFVEAERGASMAACVNRGLDASHSPVVHVLACGIQVSPGWADAALRHFGDPDVAAVGAVVVDRDDSRKIISAGFGYRAEGTAWRLGQQIEPSDILAGQQDFRGPDTLAAFYRKSAVEAVGGLSNWVGDSLAGIDLALALRHAGFRAVLEPQCLAHAGSDAIRAESAFRFGRHAERLFWRWASSHGRLSSLAGHVALAAGQCVIGLWRPSLLLQLAGRAWGLLPAIFTNRRPAQAQPAPEVTPSVVAAPHFATARIREEQRSSRVA
jgi:GT2 family glycosyltransferase